MSIASKSSAFIPDVDKKSMLSIPWARKFSRYRPNPMPLSQAAKRSLGSPNCLPFSTSVSAYSMRLSHGRENVSSYLGQTGAHHRLQTDAEKFGVD